MILTQNIISHSTDQVNSYPDPKTFLDNLPNYLKIESQLPAGLGMISIGQNAPDQQYQDIPWLELDENNNPLALKYYNGVEWIETRPYRALQAPYEGALMQYGTATMSHVQTQVNTWVDSISAAGGKFLFPEPFKAESIINIQITPVTSSVHRGEGPSSSPEAVSATLANYAAANDIMMDARKGFEWALGSDVDYMGFNMMTKTQDATPSLQFKFNWMAIGEKA